jgi:hypothetical protein
MFKQTLSASSHSIAIGAQTYGIASLRVHSPLRSPNFSTSPDDSETDPLDPADANLAIHPDLVPGHAEALEEGEE